MLGSLDSGGWKELCCCRDGEGTPFLSPYLASLSRAPTKMSLGNDVYVHLRVEGAGATCPHALICGPTRLAAKQYSKYVQQIVPKSYYVYVTRVFQHLLLSIL